MEFTKENSNHIEQLIIRCILENRPLGHKLLENDLSHLFDCPNKAEIFSFVRHHYNEFEVLPNKELISANVVSTSIKDEVNEITNTEYQAKQEKYYLKTFTEYLRDQKIRKRLMSVSADVSRKKINYQKFSDDILSIGSYEVSGGQTLFDYYIGGEKWNEIEFGPVNYYLYPIIQEENIVYVVGDPGVGKTIFVMSLLDAVSKGLSFGPWENRLGQEKVLYIDGELGPKYYQGMTKCFGINNNFINFSRSHYHRMTGKGRDIRLTNSQWREDNKKFILDNNIKIIVFDNLSSLAPDINENDKKEFDVINQYFISLRALGITVFVLHHTGKNGDQRGTSARKDQVDNFIYLRAVANHDYIKDGPRFKLSFDKSRIVLEDIKDNDLIHAKELWYQRTTRNTFEWTFDALSLSDDPEFVKHVLEGLSQRDIAKLHNTSQSTVGRKIMDLLNKELIERDDQKYKLTEQGKENYPTIVDWLEFGI